MVMLSLIDDFFYQNTSWEFKLKGAVTHNIFNNKIILSCFFNYFFSGEVGFNPRRYQIDPLIETERLYCSFNTPIQYFANTPKN